jgi:hypothetical protein
MQYENYEGDHRCITKGTKCPFLRPLRTATLLRRNPTPATGQSDTAILLKTVMKGTNVLS